MHIQPRFGEVLLEEAVLQNIAPAKDPVFTKYANKGLPNVADIAVGLTTCSRTKIVHLLRRARQRGL